MRQVMVVILLLVFFTLFMFLTLEYKEMLNKSSIIIECMECMVAQTQKTFKMKTYYITAQLIYVSADSNDVHTVEYCNDDTNIMFRAHVFTNALNGDLKAHYLCGIKIKDDVLVTLPINTPRIVF